MLKRKILSCKTSLIITVCGASLECFFYYKAIPIFNAQSLSLFTSFSTDHHCSSVARRNTDVCASYMVIPPKKQAGALDALTDAPKSDTGFSTHSTSKRSQRTLCIEQSKIMEQNKIRDVNILETKCYRSEHLQKQIIE